MFADYSALELYKIDQSINKLNNEGITMKTLKIMSLTAVAVLASTMAMGAFADTNTNSSSQPAIYAGIEGGYQNMDIDEGSSSSLLGSDTVKQPHYYANIHTGVLFPVNQTWSFGGQLGYSYYGQVKENGNLVLLGKTESKVSISSINLQGVAKAKFNQMYVAMHAGLGYFMMNGSGSIANVNGGEEQTASQTAIEPIAGVQLGYDVTDNVGVYMSYNHVFGANYENGSADTDSNSAPAMDLVGVGVDYTF